jgi:hypothetical protein
VHAQLASVLASMKPRDGVAAEPEQNWCLADERRETVLLYSLAGPAIRLLQALPQTSYTGLWFDPRSGTTRPLEGAVTATIQKPTSEPWLLLLSASR